jgi:hypothetical protein
MEFIDKSRFAASLNKIIDDFLNIGWNAADGRYFGIGFSELPKPDLRRLLLDQQDYRCVYCMMLLDPAKMSIEHLIPQSFNNRPVNEFNDYVAFRTPLKRGVIRKEVFGTSVVKQIAPPYPHDIAPSNLFASCDDKNHCNHYRQNQFIKPIVLMPLEVTKVVYNDKGVCESKDDAIINMIRVLGLNHDDLVDIRLIWYTLAKTEIFSSINDVESLYDLALSFMDLADKKKRGLKGTFKGEGQKAKLFLYSYFFTKYAPS